VRLILEALGVPLLLPAHWKKTFSLMLALRDGQLRFFGLMSLLLGGALLLLACYVLA
jgi:uncharacterized protein YjeT (DUF2065 family)